MSYRKQKKLEAENRFYKYLGLFVLGWVIGYWCGRMVAPYFGGA